MADDTGMSGAGIYATRWHKELRAKEHIKFLVTQNLIQPPSPYR